MHQLLKFIRLVILLCLTIFWGGCHDYSISLPNGYSIIRLAGENRVISDRENRLVTNHMIDGSVTKYAACGKYIIGQLSILRKGFPQKKGVTFFIIDTVSDQVTKGIDKESWEIELRRIGLNNVMLHRPSRIYVGKDQTCIIESKAP